MSNYKLNTITEVPVYLDGIFRIFDIKQIDSHYPLEYLHNTSKDMWYEELSISDKIKFEADQREKKITIKIRIPQTKEITSLNVLKIGEQYHKVYNVYHFTNKDGYKQTDITLEEYPQVRLEEIKDE